MADAERRQKENFTRIATLITKNGKKMLASLIDWHLSSLHLTFENFLNNNQHEIYHLCYNTENCCQCSPGYILPEKRVISFNHLNTLYDLSRRLSSHLSGEMCCSYAKMHVTTGQLDIVMAKIIIVDILGYIFWNKCIELEAGSFTNFLDENKHTVWHLLKYNRECCKCTSHFTSEGPILNEPQWDSLYMYDSVSQPCSKHTATQNTEKLICTSKARLGISLKDVDLPTRNILLQHCCRLTKAIESLDIAMHYLYKISNFGRIDDDTFQEIYVDIINSSLVIGSVLGNLSDVQVAFSKVLTEKPRQSDITGTQAEMIKRAAENASVEVYNVKYDISGLKSDECGLQGKEQFAANTSYTDQEENAMCCFVSSSETDVKRNFRSLENVPIVYHNPLAEDQNREVIATKISCKKHNKMFDMFCNTHGEMYCPTCTKDHKNCTVCKLNETLQQSRISEKVGEVQTLNKDLLTNISYISEEVSTELKSIDRKKDKLIKEIHKSKQNLVDMFVNVESQILQDIELHKLNLDKLSQKLYLWNLRMQLNIWKLGEITNSKKDVHLLQSLIELANDAKRSKNNLLCALEDFTPSSINPEVTLDAENFKASIFSLGLTPMSCQYTLFQSSNSNYVKYMDLKLRSEFKISIPKKARKVQIRGCSLLPNGYMWFTDRENSRVLLYDNNAVFKLKIMVSGVPVDVTAVKDNNVAISLENKSIIVVDLQGSKSEHRFEDSPGKFSGLSYYNEKLFVRVTNFGYYIIDLSGNIVGKIEKDDAYMPYITCSNNRIYFAKWDSQTVFCCDISGRDIWDFNGDGILKPPNGVAADGNANVFVTGSFSNNVVIISADGQQYKELISGRNIQHPVAVAYDENTRRLLVCCDAGSVFLYKVIYPSTNILE